MLPLKNSIGETTEPLKCKGGRGCNRFTYVFEYG